MEITSVTLVYPGRVYITAEVTEPSPDMFVTTVITYPCRLIALEIDGRSLMALSALPGEVIMLKISCMKL